MSHLRSLTYWFALLTAIAVSTGIHLAIAPSTHAQAGLSTGAIQGTILDPHGASVPSAKVSITSKTTGAKITPEVTGVGTYNSGPLAPGEYVVRVVASGFKIVEQTLIIQVGNLTPGSITLEVGSEATVVTVEGNAIAVNTEQATIQGVVTNEQIENLPINGRNFLDLAQLEPGVQLQDGGNFDPTKKGFSSISFGGRFGRTARIEVDGLDISDETVGTTTQNLPINSIKEFQVSQSNLDLSTELTSSGTVNISTKSGQNEIHGGGFYSYRDDGTSAKIGTPPAVFTRRQYGTELGGPIVKDKLFAFGSFERTTQDLLASVQVPAPFDALSGSFGSPFHDTEFLGRLDYNLTSNIRFFFKFAYEQNLNVASFVPGTYQPFANVDNTPTYSGGVDFTHGTWTHSIRVQYLKFRNGITDAVSGTNITNPLPGIALAIGNVSTSCTQSGDLFCSGANILAPQKTFQSNKQFKYDGTKTIRSHVLRYGASVNRILGGGFASFFGIDPAVRGKFTQTFDPVTGALNGGSRFQALSGPFPGGDTNPLNYPVTRIFLGNGQGCFTEQPEFGQPCGGQFDTRFSAYLGDSWKILPNLTFSYGARYNHDTGRTDSDLQAIPLLDQVSPGLGNRVRQPDRNVGGTVGIAWDPAKNGKMVIRAGAGVYYENGVFNNVLFDRPGRLTQGLFNLTASPCPSGSITFPDGSIQNTSAICNQPIGSVADQIIALQKKFQQITAQVGAQANGGYVGNALTASPALTGVTLFAPNFQTPRSYQMNIGFQRQLRPGTVISADYVRNVGVHTLLAIDENHVGDAKYLDTAGALNAINATNSSFRCSTGSLSTDIDCAIKAGATIADYAGNGLTSGTLGSPGGGPSGLGTVAFPGKNPKFGQVQFLEPRGRAVYNALQLKLTSDWKSPVRYIQKLNTQVSYSLSRFDSQAQDIDFINGALNFNNPGQFIGPGSLDRTHQLSAGVILDLSHNFRANIITHWYTGLPQSIFFNTSGNPEDLLQLDTVGDGQTGVAPIPGSNVGSFGRSIKADELNSFLQQYSNTYGNQLTPAGLALVSAGLFTEQQLQSLCAVTPSLNPTANCAGAFPNLKIQPPPSGQVGNDAFFTFDLRLGWSVSPVHRWENIRIEPQVAFFNLFNRQNYNSPTSLLSGVLDGAQGSINGTTRANRGPLALGLGSGVFALGAPRSVEFGFKISF